MVLYPNMHAKEKKLRVLQPVRNRKIVAHNSMRQMFVAYFVKIVSIGISGQSQ